MKKREMYACDCITSTDSVCNLMHVCTSVTWCPRVVVIWLRYVFESVVVLTSYLCRHYYVIVRRLNYHVFEIETNVASSSVLRSG